MAVDATNIGQEVISEEIITFQNGRELSDFLEETFSITEQEGQLLVNYMEGHGYALGHKGTELYRGDLCYEQEQIRWEFDTIDDIVDLVSEWNFEMMQSAKADMESPDNFLDFINKKSRYDNLCEDEKALDVLFDRTKYGKDLNDMAQRLAEEFIRDLTSEKGLDGAIERMKEEIQQGIEQEKGRAR